MSTTTANIKRVYITGRPDIQKILNVINSK